MPSVELRAFDPPVEQEDRPRKRRRKIWSCLQCRNRKLQCDRAFPTCSRCAKAGAEAQCTYIDDTAPTQPSQSAFHNRFGQPEQTQPSAIDGKRTSLSQPTMSKPTSERGSASLIPAPDPAPTSTLEHRLNSAQYREPMQLFANSSREKYRRSSHIRSLVNLMPGLSAFSKEARDNDHSVDQVRSELHNLQINMLSKLSKQTRPETEGDLRKLLPPKPETDRLVNVYLESYEYIYNVLDHSAFLKEYEELWQAPQETNPDFLVLVLLIIAVARSLSAMSAEGNMAIRGEVASIIESCEAFLLTKLRKQTSILDFQIAFLTLLARQINGNRFKRTWSNAGKTLRDFMSRHPVSAGLRREREPLDEEARSRNDDIGRRIWLAIAEFELQAAFEQGMPAIPWAQSSDLLPPKLGIEDEDQEFSRSSYLVVARHSLLLRHSLNSFLNNIHEPITYHETKTWTERLQSYLYALPSWTNPKALVPQALLRLNLLQYILALHERQVRETKTPFENNACRTTLLDTAMNMIEIHQSVVDSGSYAVELLFEDHLRAALTICYVYISLDPVTDSLLRKVASRYAMRSMEQAIGLLSLKAKRYGFDHRQMWITIAAAGFMQTRDRPEEKELYMQQAAKNFTDLFHEKVSQQNQIENGHGNGVGSVAGVQTMQQPTLEGSNLWELENWMLDEWPFGDEALDYWAVL